MRISTASLGSIVEVAEVEQGVDFDPTTLRDFSGSIADTSEDPVDGTLGKDQRDQPLYSYWGQLGSRTPLHHFTQPRERWKCVGVGRNGERLQ